MAEREWQHQEIAIFWQAVNLAISAPPRKIAWRTWQLPMEYLHYNTTHLSDLLCLQVKTWFIYITGSIKYEYWNQTALFSCLIHHHPQDFQILRWKRWLRKAEFWPQSKSRAPCCSSACSIKSNNNTFTCWPQIEKVTDKILSIELILWAEYPLRKHNYGLPPLHYCGLINFLIPF